MSGPQGETHEAVRATYRVLDTLPDRPDVSVGIGAGHGFKFASVVGRILAELAIAGRSAHDLEPFALDRAILQLADPPRTYMV